MEKKRTRKEQAEMTRTKILDVCRKLLKEHTYEEISIMDICEKRRFRSAHLPPFISKEALWSSSTGILIPR